MPTSPFQQPSSRRNALASLIERANQRGNARELQLLQSQWVHRYGVDSMPAHAALMSEELITREPLTDQPPTEQLLTEQSFTEQILTEQILTEQPETEQVVSEQPLSEQLVTEQVMTEQVMTEQPVSEQPITEQPVAEELVAEEHAGVANGSSPEPGDESRDDEADDASRVLDSGRPVHAVPSFPAPPISTPRSLRRWLPGAEDQLPKAS